MNNRTCFFIGISSWSLKGLSLLYNIDAYFPGIIEKKSHNSYCKRDILYAKLIELKTRGHQDIDSTRKEVSLLVTAAR